MCPHERFFSNQSMPLASQNSTGRAPVAIPGCPSLGVGLGGAHLTERVDSKSSGESRLFIKYEQM